MTTDESVDKKTLKYVLYARRSTKADGQQQRTLKDQIRLCKEVAEKQKLKIVATIKEKESAKVSFQRDGFTQMLKDIKSGKYNAIICLHPDRLARNMLEAGMLIDMLDDGSLKDITFQAYEFTNDDNGKMMLGMLFVFSKQYSDNLSKRVSIGVKGNFEEGKSSGSPKFGYTRNKDTGLYEPNQFFELIQKAWAMKLAGDSLRSVKEFLVKEGYVRQTQRGKLIRPSENSLSKMFRDPFYYGLLFQADQSVDLRSLIVNFQPMISEEDYDTAQGISRGRTRDKNSKKRAAFLPLRGMVFCAVCGSDKYMKVGKNKPAHGTHVLSYRCDTPGCERKHKSMRAHYIFDSIYEKLDSLKFTEAAYKQYSKDMDELTDEKIIELKQEARSKQGRVNKLNEKIKDLSLGLSGMDKSKSAYRINEDEIEDLSKIRADLQADIRELEKKASSGNIKVKKEEFLNLVKTVADKMKKGDPVQKDVLARILLLNLRVDDEKVVSYLWNEPFDSFVEYASLSSGGDGRN